MGALSVYGPLILLFILFFLRVPVAFSMLISTLVYFLFNSQSMPTEFIIQQMVSTTSTFSYLAIPFFVCAGVVFNYSGISTRLMNFCSVLVGHMRGALAQVNVLLSAFMGGLSGSANADTAMQSKMLVPEMEKLGYGKAFSACVTVASSCITPTIPPGIVLIMYCMMTNVSVKRLFFAGYLPGILMCIALMITVAIISHKRKFVATRDKKASAKEILESFKDASWAVVLVCVFILGLRFGVFTPTEAGAFCVVFALFVGIVIYKEIKIADLPKIFMESVENTAGIMFIIASATALGKYMTWENIPRQLADFVLQGVTKPWQFLLLTNILLLLIGCFFEGASAMVLLAPLLVPIAQGLGIDMIHLGIVICINITIAGFTPPFGNMMFISLGITGCKLEDYIKECWPFLIALLIVLAILTFIPDLVLFIPNLLS